MAERTCGKHKHTHTTEPHLDTPIDKLTDEQKQMIEDKLNNRPSRSLNYLMPNEYFQFLTAGGLITPRI